MKYKVGLSQTLHYYDVEVEADNEEQAVWKAQDIVIYKEGEVLDVEWNWNITRGEE